MGWRTDYIIVRYLWWIAVCISKLCNNMMEITLLPGAIKIEFLNHMLVIFGHQTLNRLTLN